MSRFRSSSQGARKAPLAPAPHAQLTLEEMRQRMLNRRNVDLQGLLLNQHDIEQAADDQPPTSHQPLFVGRSLVISNSPPHPSSSSTDAADPHKLFQMLRRKKRNAGPAERPLLTPTAVPRQSPDRSEPHPAIEPDTADITPIPPSMVQAQVAPRPQGAHRPPVAEVQPRYAYSAGPLSAKRGPSRDVNSAGPHSHATPDGRPATRQKLPSQSLDLFPNGVHGKSRSPTGEGDPFPKPAARKSSGRSLTERKPAVAITSANVNFNCLFVSGDNDLDGGHDDFPPVPNTQADIPLIETEWFSATNTWEELPGTNDGGASDGEIEDSSQTLYELLVAYKGRRSAKRQAS
jgi:hypothetical protein